MLPCTYVCMRSRPTMWHGTLFLLYHCYGVGICFYEITMMELLFVTGFYVESEEFNSSEKDVDFIPIQACLGFCPDRILDRGRGWMPTSLTFIHRKRIPYEFSRSAFWSCFLEKNTNRHCGGLCICRPDSSCMKRSDLGIHRDLRFFSEGLCDNITHRK